MKQKLSLNFDERDHPMNDKQYHIWTSLTRDQFNDLCCHVPPSGLRLSDVRRCRMAMAILILKLRLS